MKELIPVGDKIILSKTLIEKKKTLILSTDKEESVYNIVTFGPDVKLDIQVGDEVVLHRYPGNPISFQENEYYVVSPDQISAVFREV